MAQGYFLCWAPSLIHLLLTHLTPAKIDNNEKWSGHKVERILKVYFKLRKFSSSMKSFRCLRFRFTLFDWVNHRYLCRKRPKVIRVQKSNRSTNNILKKGRDGDEWLKEGIDSFINGGSDERMTYYNNISSINQKYLWQMEELTYLILEVLKGTYTISYNLIAN